MKKVIIIVLGILLAVALFGILIFNKDSLLNNSKKVMKDTPTIYEIKTRNLGG